MPRAVDTLGPLWAVHVTAANEQDRHQVEALVVQVPDATGDAVAGAFVDQGDKGAQAVQEAEAPHRRLEVVKLSEAKKGMVLLPKRWVVERGNAWPARFRYLARDYAQVAETLAACILWPSRY